MGLRHPGPAWLFCPADRPERYQKAAAAADVVILDLVGPSDPRIGGLAVPILDQLRPAMDFAAR